MYYSNQVACRLDEMKVFFFRLQKEKKTPERNSKKKAKTCLESFEYRVFLSHFFSM